MKGEREQGREVERRGGRKKEKPIREHTPDGDRVGARAHTIAHVEEYVTWGPRTAALKSSSAKKKAMNPMLAGKRASEIEGRR